jgi:hypothetical protein
MRSCSLLQNGKVKDDPDLKKFALPVDSEHKTTIM